MFSIDFILKWIGILPQIAQAGSAAVAAVKGALAAHGIEADTAELDAVALDADRRKAIAEAEAAG